LCLGLALGLCLGPCTATAAFTRDGDYTIAGLFPIHRLPPRAATRPRVDTCDNAQAFQSHGYHLFQTMRLTVEEINDSSSLLPNVSLGYDVYDTCSESANVHATLRALAPKGQHAVPVLPAPGHHEPAAVAVIGPDSTQLALTTAAILSVFLTPEVGRAPRGRAGSGAAG
ncbi:TS1R1 protein, partial [Crypturellus undulatus]|nr:TS1R1 protein [Crypturellus undulatus]